MQVRAFLAPLILFVLGSVSTHAAANTPVAMDSYSQTIAVTFKSEAAAHQAQLKIAGLYHDFRAAFSTRMDDNNLNGLRVAEVMAKYGQKGTFTLNDPNQWWNSEGNVPLVVAGDLSVEVPRRLQANGNSIGGHTLNHEIVPVLSKNSAFREILGARVALEAKAASPNVVFVYPFVAYKSKFRDNVDRADLDEILRRSGYYQLSEHKYNEGWDSGLQDGSFLTVDGNENGAGYYQSALTQKRGEDERPLFLITMHAWSKEWGGPEFPKLVELYRKWAGRTDWWYCNQNQYAAYLYQAQHSKLAAFVEGKVLRVVLTRADPLDLGDWTPLTFRVQGVSAEEVVSVECRGADVQPVALNGSYAFDLSHDRRKGAIGTYARTSNPANADRIDDVSTGAEGLRALLYRRGNSLSLILRNDGTQPLHDIRVVFRLPLRWKTGVIRKRVGTLKSGVSATVQMSLTERIDPAHYLDGAEYDVAQVDFRSQKNVRLYADCAVAVVEPPAFFARNGFRILGPLPGDVADFDPAVFAKPFLEGATPAQEYAVPWGGKLVWRTLEPSKTAILDPDIIPTSGKPDIPASYSWDSSIYFPHTKVEYLLHGIIISPNDQRVRVVLSRECVRYLALNGQRVEGSELNLKKGVNDVRIRYFPSAATSSSSDENNYGCYFRLIDAEGNRVKNVTFEKLPAP